MAQLPIFTADLNDPIWAEFIRHTPFTGCLWNSEVFPFVVDRVPRQAGHVYPRGDPLDPRNEALCDVLLYQFVFMRTDITEAIQWCEWQYQVSLADVAVTMKLVYRMHHILDGLFGHNREDSYGPRIHDLIQMIMMDEVEREATIISLRERIYQESMELQRPG
ncbi:hypothetical protein FQN55_005276 [Onygenales sp. PD_40]|nr:hypothetical protein FQN55_005276 [Onygenales sp. PD_40]